MRRDAQHIRALGQRFADQRHVALREVANTTMQELGGAGRGASTKVVRLQEGDGKTAQGGVQGHTQAGGPASDDDKVEGLILGQGLKVGSAGHRKFESPCTIGLAQGRLRKDLRFRC